jgi:hypothetical protein
MSRMSVVIKPTKNVDRVSVILLYQTAQDEVWTQLVYSGPTKAAIEFDVQEGYQWKYAASGYKGPSFRVLADYGTGEEQVDLVPQILLQEIKQLVE